jgi:hypothetical protein
LCGIVTNPDRTPLFKPLPHFLKTLATLFSSSRGLYNIGALCKNTIFVDDLSYEDIKNYMWNIVHSIALLQVIPTKQRAISIIIKAIAKVVEGIR